MVWGYPLISDYSVGLFDLLMSLSETLDMVDPALAGHHKQVAYLSSVLAAELRLPAERRRACLVAGTLHDIGGISSADRVALLQFEDTQSSSHAQVGSRLLATFELFRGIAPIVAHHHTPWQGSEDPGVEVPLEAHIVHLADRVAVLVDRQREVLGQVPGILERIRAKAGQAFAPEAVAALEAVADRECVWLDLVSSTLGSELRRHLGVQALALDMEEVLELARFFARLVDFRSRFTATHSAGVAEVARRLAALVGFAPREQVLMQAAGLFHDLGKLGVPGEVLEYPGKLDDAQRNLMRAHTWLTWRALRPIRDFEGLAQWAAYHHERLDGSGYPFHLADEQLPLGSRIMAVADVFVALTETRPYRPGMSVVQATGILERMALQGALDRQVVDLCREHRPDLDEARAQAQVEAFEEYRRLAG